MSLAAIKARLAEESGMTLVEVLTSAILLVIVSLGVTKGIDTASRASGGAKLKTTASMLAQQDQERMRSFSMPNLVDYEATRSKQVRGIPFTIVSEARWVSDGSGTESCAAAGSDGDDAASYLRITSTVTWLNMHGMDPVVATSLVAPPNGSFGEQGSLLVEVLDRNAAGIAGLSIGATPLAGTGGALSETTGSSGCAFFGYLPPVNYRIAFQRAGHVTPAGVQAVVQDVGVTSSATNRASFLYDLAGQMNVAVVTRRPGSGADEPATAEHITVGHSGLPAPGRRLFGGAPAASHQLTGLFPFTSTYAVYSGNCPGASPTAHGAPGVFALVQPGAAAAVTVREVAVRVDKGSNDVTHVRLSPRSDGCGGAVTYPVVGDLLSGDSAVPFGRYDVCVQRNHLLGPLVGRYLRLDDQALVNPNGHVINATTSSWSTSSCMG